MSSRWGRFMIGLGELLFRLKLYLMGVRFYTRHDNQEKELIYEAQYRLSPTDRIEFKFFKVKCHDIVLRRGGLTTQVYSSYIVEAYFHGTVPQELTYYHGKSLFFNGMVNEFEYDDRQASELILDIYLDFIKTIAGEKPVTI